MTNWQAIKGVTLLFPIFFAYSDVKQDLRSAVLWPLKLPHLFKGYRKPPKTFLLVGPPGTGKTMLVEKVRPLEGRALTA